MKTPVKISHFLVQADVLASSIGLILYEDESQSGRFRKLKNCICFILIANLHLVAFAEFMFTFMAILHGENFKETTMSLSYFGFAFVSIIKLLSVLKKKSLLNLLMRHVRQLFPADLKLQAEFETRRYMIRYNVISFGFVCCHQALIWAYNLYPAVSYFIYDYWLAAKIVPKSLPFSVWLPWNWQDHWSYYLLFISENAAGHTCMAGQLANDLILCAVATQIIMHYRYLARHMEMYQPSKIYEEDVKFLKDFIQYHQKILSLSSYMNEVFGVSLLVNFISSSFTMCFLGLQMTIGVQADALIMLLMFLFCSLLQILMMCCYGQELISVSESVGQAAYSHNWLETDVRYRKMLAVIMGRAQKPALLRATNFVTVSMGTMTDLMQLSYKFFAVLRTMYSN